MDLNKLSATVANNLSAIAAKAIEDKEIAKAQRVHPKFLKKALRRIWKRVSEGKNSAHYNGYNFPWYLYWNMRVAEGVKYSLENMGYKVDIVQGTVACDFNVLHVPELFIRW